MTSINYELDKLTSENYATLKTVVKSHLMSKDLWEYVREQKNETDTDKIKNEEAKHLLYVSMEAHEIAASGVCETAHDLWVKIRENHEGAEEHLQSIALSELLSIKYMKIKYGIKPSELRPATRQSTRYITNHGSL